MPFAYYAKLSPAKQRTYRKSDALTSLALPPGVDVGASVKAIAAALVADDRAATQAACQRLVDALTAGYHVPPVMVRVLARRPSDASGELQGLYEPGEGSARARITVWRRTAARQQVVAFKTFLRTVVHEVCHHLDYELFALDETFHTEGFYKRESSLANALLATALQSESPKSMLVIAGDWTLGAEVRVCAPPDGAKLLGNVSVPRVPLGVWR